MSEATIAATEKLNELRAKRRWHSLQEMQKAAQIQAHIKCQSVLDDEILKWELFLAKEKALAPKPKGWFR